MNRDSRAVREAALAAVLLTTPLVSWQGVHTAARLFWVTAVLLALVGFELWRAVQRGQVLLPRTAADPWVLGYLAWSLASAAWSDPVGPALTAAGTLVAAVVLFYVAADIGGYDRSVLIAGLAGGLGPALWAIWQHHGLGIARPAGTFGNPVVAGPYFGFALMLAGAWALERRSRWAAAGAVVFAYALWLSATRAALLGALVGAVLLVERWAAARARRARAWGAIALVAALGVLVAWIGREGVAEHLWRHRPLTAQRWFYLRDGLELFSRAPLWGHGLGSFYLRFPEVMGDDYFSAGGPNAILHAHDEYLEIACEVGIVGLALFLGVALSSLRRGLHAAEEAAPGSWPRCLQLGAIGGVALLLVDNLANVDLRAGSSPILLWAGLGILAARPAARATLRLGGLRSLLASACVLALLLYGFSAYRQFRGQVDYLQGRRLYSSGDLPAAAAAYRQALGWDPDNLLAACDLGIVESQRGHVSAALSALMLAYSQAPRFAGVAHNLGVLLTQAGRPRQALPFLRQALQINPRSRLTREWLGRAEREAAAGG